MPNQIKHFLFNTNYLDSAGAKVCVTDLSGLLANNGYMVTKNDWEYQGNYDIILFMAPDAQIKKAREQKPQAIIGLMDPKIGSGSVVRTEDIKNADFLLVSSLEQREKLLALNENIFIYYMFPDIKRLEKRHEKKDKIIIGYHGNKRHLENFDPDINWALEKLAQNYNIELWPMYNVAKLGKWIKGAPRGVKINEIQWSEENYYKYLSQCDIGLVPNQIPLNNIMKKFLLTRYWKKLDKSHHYSGNDYVVRYKFSTNPGRIYVFSQLGIPVISDYSPSSCQFIIDGQTGFIAGTREGWYRSLRLLIEDNELRQACADDLYTWIEKNYSIDINFNKLIAYISALKH